MDERRSSPRKRSFLKGTVYFNNRQSSVDCVIRDLSDDGARLEFGSIVSLPDTVELSVPARGQTHRAEIRWRTDQEIGVCFNDGAAPARAAQSGGGGDLERRVYTLEQEVERLHRQFVQLRTEFNRRRGE